MSLLPCPACGREVSRAATACPQCGQPIAGVVVPPPLPPRGTAFAVDALKIDESQRATATASNAFRIAAVSVFVFAAAVVWITRDRPTDPASAAVPPSADDLRRASAAKTIADALRPTGVEYVNWQGNTLLVVTSRMAGDMQAVADAACVALRGQGVRGNASVAVLERNAFLNGRREYLGDARCSLPR
ncbi:MAG: hypothetical protein ACK51F_10585 [Rhodospirillales bacterium]